MNGDAPNGSESRNTLDMGGIGTTGTFHPTGESSGAGNDVSFDIASEIKRWQQLHQANLPSSSTTALLSSSGAGNNLPHDASTAALIHQMLESQQQRGSNSNRFDIPLATSMGLAGSTFGSIVGSGDSNFGNDLFSNNDNSNNGALNPLPSNFFSDARLLMAQQAVASMNFPSYPGLQLQQQSQVPTENNSNGLELPLPSPHSLFHRDGTRRMRGGVIEPFPEKLHRLLMEVESAGRADIISFVSGGRAFQIHKPDKFFKDIVPLYFRQSRLSSFKRQLNLYGFELINTGPSRGGYFHELFVKDEPELCRRMRRVAVKVVLKSEKPEDTEENDMSEIMDLHRSSAGISGFDF